MKYINPVKELKRLQSLEHPTEEEISLRDDLEREKSSYDELEKKQKETWKAFPFNEEKLSSYFDINGNPISMWEFVGLSNSDERRISETQIGDYWVSTVHLVLDHSMFGNTPIIFETMIFNTNESFCNDEKDPYNRFQERYSTLQQAKDGHEKSCRMVREGRSVDDWEIM